MTACQRGQGVAFLNFHHDAAQNNFGCKRNFGVVGQMFSDVSVKVALSYNQQGRALFDLHSAWNLIHRAKFGFGHFDQFADLRNLHGLGHRPSGPTGQLFLCVLFESALEPVSVVPR